MKELVLNTDKFLLESIQEKKNVNLLNRFRASHEQIKITKHFKKLAKKEEAEGSARTFVVKVNSGNEDSNFLVMAFTIKLNPIPYVSESGRKEHSDFISALQITYLATNETIVNMIKNSVNLTTSIGTYIYSTVIEPLLYHIANLIGNTDIVYLYAVNSIVKKIYENWGFTELKRTDDLNLVNKKIRKQEENDCIFMFKKLDPKMLNPDFNS
ncbi:hypothetical protein [uncultured Treponema sp.]|uniref:hypothetical protein n=1 Tax=uncultured Treponema sp. TaxID=162155 RepID=UPI0026014BD3|nr:hypothetical protein [uncultured Treponema sp.]